MKANLKKLANTLRILFVLGMARTFGDYIHSAWNGECDVAVYRWHGKEWTFPLNERKQP